MAIYRTHILLLIIFLIFAGKAFNLPVLAAATPSAAASPSGKVDSRAQDILNRVTTKVEELANKQRKTYFGTVKSVGTKSYVVTTLDGDKTISTNDAASFFRIRAGNRTEVKFENIKVGDDLAAVGTIDPSTGEMTARQIIVKIARQNISGMVSAVDKGVVTVNQPDQTPIKIDLDSAITLKKMDNTGKVTTAKGADFTVNSPIFVIGYASDKPDVLSVLKALVLTK